MTGTRKPIIGLEIHIELKTKTKMFCDSLNDPDEKHPNINVCPICMGHPGTLPVINKEAVEKVIMAGIAFNCQIEHDTFFERKNYFYPDLPKGYQISQYQKPLCYKGHLKLASGKTINITRIHLEEDAGRLYHMSSQHQIGDGRNIKVDNKTGEVSGIKFSKAEEYSLVDYSRAGVPLMELVTEPDFENGDEVREFSQELQLIARYLGISDADMEKGQMRVEVNISLTGDDGKWGTKVEIKNLNSIKAAANSVDFEIKRQGEILDEGGKIIHETRGWDETKGITFSQRTKEEAHDYRYFPEPDLPPMHFEDADIETIKAKTPELPAQRRVRFEQYELNKSQIDIFTIARHLGDYYEKVASELNSAAKDYHIKNNLKGDNPFEAHVKERLHSLSANYIITEFPGLMNATGMEIDDLAGFKISPEAFAELIVLIFHQKLSSTGAKAVLKEMAETGLHPEQIIKEKGLEQVSDTGELDVIINKIIEANPNAVADYKKGKEASLKFLIGMVMRESKGKANPQMVEEILKNKLK